MDSQHSKGSGTIQVISIITVDSILDNSHYPIRKARLLAASSKESGVWLNVTPVTSLGLRLDNTAVRIAMGLCLGLQLCRPNTCQHCGAQVTEFTTHGLSCRKSAGRHFRHAALNDIIHRALSAAHIPSHLEPSGLARADGERPDGITLAPWKCRQLLVWDATCPDTYMYAPSSASIAVAETGAVANQAECKKQLKYVHLGTGHIFTPVAIESSGVFGTDTVCKIHKRSWSLP